MTVEPSQGVTQQRNPSAAPTVADLASALQIAVAHHQAGRLPQAEVLYRQILQAKPDHADALHLLGLIAQQGGQHEIAVELIGKALAFVPNYAEAHYNLGVALKDQGKLEDAVASYRQALRLKPSHVEAHYNLGVALKEQGKLDEAVASYREALELKPDHVNAHNNLGNIRRTQGDLNEAVASYRIALALRPDCADAHNNLGVALKDQGELDDAVACYRRAIALKADYAEAHYNLGEALQAQGRLDEAVYSYCQALVLKPDYADAHMNLGGVLQSQGQLDKAVANYRRALALKPNFVAAYSNFLFALNFIGNIRPAEIFAAHREFGRRFAPASHKSTHGNVPDPERKLRIGYVSGDLRAHVVARFIEPILAHRDCDAFEIICYYNNARADAITERLRLLVDGWRDVFALNDDALAHLISVDGVDILVDLSGHTALGRLLVFGRKPAPVQVTYLGYPGTTGLEMMDYRLTDECADPRGTSEHCYTEQLVRLPDSLWCYKPDETMPPVSALPALSNGYVTFGSLNSYTKINSQVLALWARLLAQVPDSRLIMATVPEGHAQETLRAQLAELEIPANRLEFYPPLPPANFRKLYSRIDIALDPYPVGGGATTCESLWMGVPVVTLIGSTFISRASYSLLCAAGLADLAAPNEGEYVRLATNLARNVKGIGDLRAGMRKRLAGSALMDAPRFTRQLEEAYRSMWRTYCANRQLCGYAGGAP